MTTAAEPPPPEPGRSDNGLRAAAYVPLTDVEPAVGERLLTALGRARIAAYLVGGTDGDAQPDLAADRRRLFVASDERTDARSIVAAAVRELDASTEVPAATDDPLAGIDTKSAFDALVADWHVDTHTAVRDAERDLRREDAEWRSRLNRRPAEQPDEQSAGQSSEEPVWLDDDHYIPPPPPPLPRLAGLTILAMAVLVVSIFVLGFGGYIGLSGYFTFVLGVMGLLLGAFMLFSRVRTTGRDEDDDGSAV